MISKTLLIIRILWYGIYLYSEIHLHVIFVIPVLLDNHQSKIRYVTINWKLYMVSQWDRKIFVWKARSPIMSTVGMNLTTSCTWQKRKWLWCMGKCVEKNSGLIENTLRGIGNVVFIRKIIIMLHAQTIPKVVFRKNWWL